MFESRSLCEAVDVSPILAEMVIEEERVGAAEVEGSAEGVKPSVAVTEGDELVLGVGRGTGALGDVDSVADAEVLDVGPVEADSLAGGPAILGVCPGGAPEVIQHWREERYFGSVQKRQTR